MLLQKMIIKNSLDVIGDDNIDDDDSKDNKYYNCSDDYYSISFSNVKLNQKISDI